jgi:membrane-associated phospholipid phosphatase
VNQRGNIAKPGRNTADRQVPAREYSASRREFVTLIPGAAVATLASTAISFGSSAEAGERQGNGSDGTERARDSYEIREGAARGETEIPVPRQITNGDEQNSNLKFIGNYSKGLPHNAIGEVDPTAYLSFLKAVRQGTAAAFENVPLGGDPSILGGLTKLVNPLAGLAFDLEGTDSHQLVIPPFPSVSSRELAAQAVELYWMALCRDVPFTEYESNTPGGKLAQEAAMELSSLPGFTGPRSRGKVTPQTLFRGFTTDDVNGPYVSQLLLCPFNYGPYAMDGKMSMYVPAVDYMIEQGPWLAVQNGKGPFGPNTVDSVRRYIRNGRDFAMFVHNDPLAGLFMSFYNSGMVLAQNGAPLNPGNPYRYYKTQDSFGTFGLPFFFSMMGEATVRALKAAWYAKWFVHRALRPEEFGGLVHMTKTGQAGYPLHSDILQKSQAMQRVFAKNGTYFLPLAFPEGSPQHPSYPEGHATMAGACATILKAAFDGSLSYTELPGNGTIVTANADGTALVPYSGSDAGRITINGEINKLASNIGQARDIAGVHWRSDSDYGLRLGEAVAISILRDQSNNHTGEDFEGFTITTFDGKTITV